MNQMNKSKHKKCGGKKRGTVKGKKGDKGRLSKRKLEGLDRTEKWRSGKWLETGREFTDLLKKNK